MVLAWTGLVVCDYRYGVNDQAQYLVQMMAARDSGLFASDPYLLAFDSLHSIFWTGMARITPASLQPEVILLVTLLIAATNAFLLMLIGERLFPRKHRTQAAAMAGMLAALVFVTPKEQNWFGLVGLADVELTATFAAVPCVFAATLLWIRGHVWWSLAACLFALPLHGQTGAAMCGTWTLAACFAGGGRPRLTLAGLGMGVIGMVGLTVLAVRDTMPPADLDRLHAIGSALYEPLIDPLAVPPKSWVGLVVLLSLGAWGAHVLWRRTEEGAPARRLLIWGLASLVFPVGGMLVHAIGVEHALLWKLMVGRAFMLSQIVSLLLTTVAAVKLISEAGTSLNRLRLRSALMTALLTVLVVWPMAWKEYRIGFPALKSGHKSGWLEAQAWAHEQTPADALFITPPYLSDWRIGSGRATYGEIKDGCLLFYTGDGALEWAVRMEWLGMPSTYPFKEARHSVRGARRDKLDRLRASYRSALLSSVDTFADSPTVYVVVEAVCDAEVGDPVWHNNDFIIRCVASPRTPVVVSADQDPD